MEVIRVIIMGFEDIWVVIFATVPLNLPIRTVEKKTGSWRMTMNYCKPNQRVILISAEVLEVVLLL
jgi:hypothetical protein